jgi:hypothetical protein
MAATGKQRGAHRYRQSSIMDRAGTEVDRLPFSAIYSA